MRSSSPRRAHCRQGGKILDSCLSYPTFLSNFPFEAAPSMNLGWVDVDGLAGHTKHALFFQEVLEKIRVFISPEYILSYSIYSLAHLSWHGTCENELWMVDLGFLLPFPFKVSVQTLRMMNFGGQDFGFLLFLIPCSFQSFFSIASKNKVCMVDLGFLFSLSLFPFKVSFPEASRHEF